MIRVTHILPSTGLGGVQKNLLSKAKYDKEFNVKRKVICIIRKHGELEKNFKAFCSSMKLENSNQ